MRVSLPESLFLLPGFHKPYRLDKTATSGGLLVYVRSSIASRLMNLHQLPTDIQLIPIELNLRKQTWLSLALYRPRDQNLSYFIDIISELLDVYAKNYERKLKYLMILIRRVVQ